MSIQRLVLRQTPCRGAFHEEPLLAVHCPEQASAMFALMTTSCSRPQLFVTFEPAGHEISLRHGSDDVCLSVV
jgi:hypothetical protein